MKIPTMVMCGTTPVLYKFEITALVEAVQTSRYPSKANLVVVRPESLVDEGICPVDNRSAVEHIQGSRVGDAGGVSYSDGGGCC
jgi:hypothetical protein